ASGGTAVLADEDVLGLDVVLSPDDPLWESDLTQSYRWLGEAWCEALRYLGIPATLVSVQEARADARDTSEEAGLARAACFAALAARGLALLDGDWTPEEQAFTERLIAERYQPLSLH